MDIAQILNATDRVTFAGREFAARQLKLSEWAALQQWLKREFPSPYTTALASVEQARRLGMPLSDEVRDEALRHAAELSRAWPPRVGSPAWLRALDTVEGGAARFVEAALLAAGNDPAGFDAAALAEAATPGDWDALTRACYFGDPPGPKAPTAAAGTPTPTTGTPDTTGAPTSTP
jgi:hypothetical protein